MACPYGRVRSGRRVEIAPWRRGCPTADAAPPPSPEYPRPAPAAPGPPWRRRRPASASPAGTARGRNFAITAPAFLETETAELRRRVANSHARKPRKGAPHYAG